MSLRDEISAGFKEAFQVAHDGDGGKTLTYGGKTIDLISFTVVDSATMRDAGYMVDADTQATVQTSDFLSLSIAWNRDVMVDGVNRRFIHHDHDSLFVTMFFKATK